MTVLKLWLTISSNRFWRRRRRWQHWFGLCLYIYIYCFLLLMLFRDSEKMMTMNTLCAISSVFSCFRLRFSPLSSFFFFLCSALVFPALFCSPLSVVPSLSRCFFFSSRPFRCAVLVRLWWRMVVAAGRRRWWADDGVGNAGAALSPPFFLLCRSPLVPPPPLLCSPFFHRLAFISQRMACGATSNLVTACRGIVAVKHSP